MITFCRDTARVRVLIKDVPEGHRDECLVTFGMIAKTGFFDTDLQGDVVSVVSMFLGYLFPC
jgi:hypothetical protein